MHDGGSEGMILRMAGGAWGQGCAHSDSVVGTLSILLRTEKPWIGMRWQAR